MHVSPVAGKVHSLHPLFRQGMQFPYESLLNPGMQVVQVVAVQTLQFFLTVSHQTQLLDASLKENSSHLLHTIFYVPATFEHSIHP